MTEKKMESKNGKHHDLIEMLQNHNVIVNKDVAMTHADKMLPICHTFIKELTSILSPDDYLGQSSEFIEMVIAGMTYTSASLLIALYDMFPLIDMKTFKTNFNKSLDSSIHLQMQNRG